MKKVLLFCFCLMTIESMAQPVVIDEQWWSNLVGWDGISHWSEYQIHSPAFLGPNALPVPRMTDGRIDNISSISTGGQFHFSDGDNTQNLTLYFNYNFLKDVISVDLFFVPVEFFQLSHEVREERRTYYQFYDVSNATGDVYLNTNFRVLSEENNKIDMAVRIGLKTASGGNANPARFTDTPGYYFDASFGKQMNDNWRLYSMFGFYSWETNDDVLPQNDALLYGLGFEYSKNSISIQNEITGYNGYKDNGDKPALYRLNFSKEFTNLILGLNYQHGLRDFDYKTIECLISYKLFQNREE